MKHVALANGSLLMGDEVADLLLDYAALVAQLRRGDIVRLRAIGADGDEVVAGVLLSSATTMLVLDAQSALSEPDNAVAVAYLRRRIAEFGSASHFALDEGPGAA